MSKTQNNTPRRKMSRLSVGEKIHALLADGKPHTHTELMECLYDELSSFGAVRYHLTMLRHELKAANNEHEIICQLINNKRHYRMICTHLCRVDRSRRKR